ncbi:MAG: outer membrane beta-barrel protein [Bacteroidales bacterium]|nr:outer membrane beta-barrel protein [Bacteroidales bacterium]
MKRLIIIALIVIPFTMVSNAQVKFGLKLGITSTSISVNDLITIDADGVDDLLVKGADSRVGIQGGLMARITILKLYIQPELLLTSTGGEVEVTEYFTNGDDAITKIKEQSFNKIDIPIMVGYKIGPLRLQVGPIASIVVSNKSALTDYNNYEEEFNGATWGYQAGLGLDIGKKLTIDVKYEGSLSKLANGVNISGQSFDFDSRSSQIVASLGFFF